MLAADAAIQGATLCAVAIAGRDPWHATGNLGQLQPLRAAGPTRFGRGAALRRTRQFGQNEITR